MMIIIKMIMVMMCKNTCMSSRPSVHPQTPRLSESSFGKTLFGITPTPRCICHLDNDNDSDNYNDNDNDNEQLNNDNYLRTT